MSAVSSQAVTLAGVVKAADKTVSCIRSTDAALLDGTGLQQISLVSSTFALKPHYLALSYLLFVSLAVAAPLLATIDMLLRRLHYRSPQLD